MTPASHTIYIYEYNINLDARHPNQHKYNKNTDPQNQKTKWAIFTHSSKDTKKITKVFKKINRSTIPNTKHNTNLNLQTEAQQFHRQF
jgi:hypothetical protein